MTFTIETLDETQEQILSEWLTVSGYADADEWAADSDYTETGGIWTDEDGVEVDPATQAWYAMEVAAEAGDEDAEAAIAKYDATFG